MTREEAISQLQDAKDGYKEYLSKDALDMAIKALEQEPTNSVLEDIKAEIKALPCYGDGNYPLTHNLYIDGKAVLAILDKYKAESEESK